MTDKICPRCGSTNVDEGIDDIKRIHTDEGLVFSINHYCWECTTSWDERFAATPLGIFNVEHELGDDEEV